MVGIDIENSADYEQLASDIIENKPNKIFVFAEMAEVVDCWKQRGSSSITGNRENGIMPAQPEPAPETKLELGLGRARNLLLKKWRKDSSSQLMVYVGPEGNVQLTPQQARDWVMAIVSIYFAIHLCTNNQSCSPPRLCSSQRPSMPASDPLAHVATIITSLTAMVGSRALATPQTLRPVPTSSSPIRATSPPINTLSRLHAYLIHARDKLGVTRALEYHDVLAKDGYGPDILHKVDAEKLTCLSVSTGDAIRLQDGGQAWWQGPEAKKCKRDDSVSTSSTVQGSESHTCSSPRPRWAFDVAEPDKPCKVAFSVKSPSGRLARYTR
uniref:PH domain-containing protein n=1 Tax=Mycena chlorophos TaxID=658473 RepID=A0ABQ0M6Z0_MYCCL|nr:predicted protein [Mycena chlorophos]